MQSTIEVPTTRDMVSQIKGSILSMPEAQYEALSAQEQKNLTEFLSYAKRYQQRLCLPLSEDPFAEGLSGHLERSKVKFARVPFRSIDTVYYLFTDVSGIAAMTSFMGAGEHVSH